jgi:hypothetical protein
MSTPEAGRKTFLLSLDFIFTSFLAAAAAAVMAHTHGN